MTEETQGVGHLPADVIENARKADEMIKALNTPNAGQQADATQQASGQDTGAASPAQAQGQQDTAPAAPGQQPPAQSQDDEGYKAKYDTLRGKYDAEVPRLRSQVSLLVSEVSSLKDALQRARSAQPDTGNQPGAAIPDTGRQPGDGSNHNADSFDPDDFKDYGDDFVKLVAEVNRLKTENAQLRGTVDQVNTTVQTSDAEKFYAALANKVQDWESMNYDPKFLEYLGQIHPITGRPLIESLRDAESKRDVERAAIIFNDYKKTLDRPTKPTAQTVPPPKPPLSPKAGQGATEVPQSLKTYTRGDIKQFYDDKTKGVYRGRDEEFARIERDIFAAMKEGRVIG
ncbi:MAG: hypothetical protein RBT11_14150 [Desulfobacterales bacterium]|jgi:hypothetical protein|nr:hypothetical protein [Desulfobacterales bacterium]